MLRSPSGQPTAESQSLVVLIEQNTPAVLRLIYVFAVPTRNPSVWCLCVCVGSSWVLQPPLTKAKNIYIRLMGSSKLPAAVDVNESANSCLCLCEPADGKTPSPAQYSWNRL